MNSALKTIFLSVRQNKWHWFFYWFCRITLAIGFTIAGMVKIMGERFASGLDEIHPMGSYLVALHHTGYYYTFIGIAQVLAALLLLVNRTALVGALLYFPIILNIWVLSLAVRFDGSYISSTWMVLANLYLLCYHYDRIRTLWIKDPQKNHWVISPFNPKSHQFPFRFFGSSLVILSIPIMVYRFGYEALPRNSLELCQKQFVGTGHEAAGKEFCECIHIQGRPLDSCLEQFELNKNLNNPPQP
ncbi:MAG: DoxX family protein [Cyclobacteriaceae bacterium]|nr:DoxX family protein [Cyclobacteriaceae bacterium]MDX5468030.1 DoxX family protein [Cyclobacteriaceae bacterium]